ncbi:hypothetical protein, partial [Streptomyces sp. NPDC058142]|uniref:hypothetical protein n=1 Tax=Streptomyces sp. NPDC058142 TaxID=3346355 RepID=UPI0036E4F2CB
STDGVAGTPTCDSTDGVAGTPTCDSTDGVAAAGGTAPGLVSGDSADAPADTSATGPPSTPADDPAT